MKRAGIDYQTWRRISYPRIDDCDWYWLRHTNAPTSIERQPRMKISASTTLRNGRGMPSLMSTRMQRLTMTMTMTIRHSFFFSLVAYCPTQKKKIGEERKVALNPLFALLGLLYYLPAVDHSQFVSCTRSPGALFFSC